MSVTVHPIAFESEGATLRGRLYLPEGDPPFPVVAMANGFSATITMTIHRYAEAFASSGVAALLWDHRNFGVSDGEPRQQINPWLQARGYRSALDVLAAESRVDPERIGLWGDSMAGGIVLVVAACDERVRVVVAQVPACGRTPPPEDPNGQRFAQIRVTLLEGDINPTPDTTVGPLPVVSADQAGTPSLLTPLTAFRWFIEYGARHNSGWQNQATRAAPPTSLGPQRSWTSRVVTSASCSIRRPSSIPRFERRLGSSFATSEEAATPFSLIGGCPTTNPAAGPQVGSIALCSASRQSSRVEAARPHPRRTVGVPWLPCLDRRVSRRTPRKICLR
jgi:alpha-beta hydrolase superfamily lysophospholipase